MQTAQLDPQAQALLNQMSAMSAQAPTPASPLSPEQELAAARLGYRAAIPLAGSSEAVYKVEDRYLTGPEAVLPAMRKQRSGQILNLSSVGGFVSFGTHIWKRINGDWCIVHEHLTTMSDQEIQARRQRVNTSQ